MLRKEAYEVDDDVEVPCIMGRVLGNRSAEEIVDTEEIQDEIIPVDMPHDAVPGSSDESKEDEAGNQVDMEHFTDVLLIEKEEDASKTREKDSNRSLCQCRKKRLPHSRGSSTSCFLHIPDRRRRQQRS